MADLFKYITEEQNRRISANIGAKPRRIRRKRTKTAPITQEEQEKRFTESFEPLRSARLPDYRRLAAHDD